MFVVRLAGGLGNQLFQIATALSMSEGDPKRILVDRSTFDVDRKHGGYRLDKLCLPHFDEHKPKILGISFIKLLDRFPILTRFTKHYIHEKYYGGKVGLIKNGILIGYWQNHRYFDRHFDLLRRFFVPKNIDAHGQRLCDQIKSCNSVSVHIRRGDYTNPSVLDNHGVCSTRYYEDAVLSISKKLDNPHFFIFTNDHGWVKDNLMSVFSDFNVTYVKNNEQEVDLWLMSMCRHNIIANSSFSWWGAYLAKGNDQIVISPEPWYERKQRASVDPSLSSWLRIDKN